MGAGVAGTKASPNPLGRVREERPDRWVFRYANGLEVHTDPFLSSDRGRILPLGGPQDTLMSRLVRAPEHVRGRRVLDVFAGSGILGLMALRLGAAHVDFLDVNPRAGEFQRANAERNGFSAGSFEVHVESIESFAPDASWDLLLANPPFVPTPPGIAGSLTSAAGSDGNALVAPLLAKLERLLRPEGEAFVYLMQIVSGAGPLVTALVEEHVRGRETVLTPTQEEVIPFDEYCGAYRRCFPTAETAIESWRADLLRRHGELGVQQYVMHVGPRRPGVASWVVRDDLPESYGIARYPAATNAELALGRVLENVVPAGSRAAG